jgi:hypothetical protein
VNHRLIGGHIGMQVPLMNPTDHRGRGRLITEETPLRVLALRASQTIRVGMALEPPRADAVIQITHCLESPSSPEDTKASTVVTHEPKS